MRSPFSTRAMSEATISLQSSCIGILGTQPSFSLALAGSPISSSTSVGRKYFGSIRTRTRDLSACRNQTVEVGSAVKARGTLRRFCLARRGHAFESTVWNGPRVVRARRAPCGTVARKCECTGQVCFRG